MASNLTDRTRPTDVRQADVPCVARHTIEPLPLRQNFSWTLAGNIVYTACQWGVLVVLAKLGSPEAVGQYSLALAVATPVILLAGLQLRAVLAADAAREFRFGDYFALRLATTLLALCVLLAVVVFGSFNAATALVLIVVGAAKALEAVADIIYGLFQQHERLDRIATSIMLNAVMSVMGVVGLFTLTGSLPWAITATIASRVVVLATYDSWNLRCILTDNPKLNRSSSGARMCSYMLAAGKLAWRAFPLGLTMMLISLNTSVPRYIIEYHLGTHQLGIFAAISYLLAAGTMVIGALGQSACPRLARYYTEDDVRAFRLLLFRLVAIALLLSLVGTAVGAALGPQLLTILYSHEYTAYSDILVGVLIVGGVMFISSMLGYGMTAARRYRIQGVMHLASVCVTFVAGSLLIPRYGLKGAVFALGLAAVVQVLSGGLVIGSVLRDGHRHPEVWWTQ